METQGNQKHMGRTVSRIRELRGMKQEALAYALGLSQQSISLIENSPDIDEGKLHLLAKALDVSVRVLEDFTEENFLRYLDTLRDADAAVNLPHNCGLAILDLLLEACECNKKLQADKERLYERLLLVQQEKFDFLQKANNQSAQAG